VGVPTGFLLDGVDSIGGGEEEKSTFHRIKEPGGMISFGWRHFARPE
jgi:hypothetical protein